MIGNAVKGWRSIRGGWLLDFDWDRNFESLMILKKAMALSFDSTRQYVATMRLVGADEMDEHWRHTFLNILGAQAVLSWKGFVARKPYFEISLGMDKLKRVVADLKPNVGLVERLNSDTRLLALISQLRPDELRLGLTILTPTESGMPLNIYEFMNDPREITWTISIEKYMTRGFDAAKLVTCMVDIMDTVLGKARSFTLETREKMKG